MLTWRQLYRSWSVATVLFFFPLMWLRLWDIHSLFLSPRELLTEFASWSLALLLFEALAAGLIAILLMALRAMQPTIAVVAQRWFAGALTLAVIAASLLLLAQFDHLATPNVMPVIDAVIVVLLAWAAYANRRTLLQTLEQCNKAARWLPPLVALLLGFSLIDGGLEWQPYDPMPQPRSVDTPNPGTSPNFILISLDACSAEDLSLYGYQLDTSPAMKRLAKQGYSFSHVISASDFTTPGVVSLLTGKSVATHGVFQLGGHLYRNRNENVAQVLKDHGYVTGALVTNVSADPKVLQLAKSFAYVLRPPVSAISTFLMQLQGARFDDLISRLNDVVGPIARRYLALNHFGGNNKARRLAEKSLEMAAQMTARMPQPFFLWVHILPPHAPYLPAPEFRGRFLSNSDFTTLTDYEWSPVQAEIPYAPAAMQATVDELRLRYDESIAEVDAAVGRFVTDLRRTAAGQHTIVVITADHGENFWGKWQHGTGDLRYPEIHIPLLIVPPTQTSGVVSTEDADSTDIAPTILALAHIDTPQWMEGHPLLPMSAQPIAGGGALTEDFQKSSALGGPLRGAVSLVAGQYKLTRYLDDGRVELYDVARDPQQRADIAAGHPKQVDALLNALEHRLGANNLLARADHQSAHGE